LVLTNFNISDKLIKNTEMKGEDMKVKLYKLALWYIAKCNAKWDNRKLTNALKALNRLTYWNFGKYMLTYGADAEWQKFGRYEVLDNAIQKLAQYENDEQEIRAKAIDEFAERLKELCGYEEDGFQYPYLLHESRIDEIAEEMKEGVNNA